MNATGRLFGIEAEVARKVGAGFAGPFFWIVISVLLGSLSGAAATVNVQIDPAQVKADEPFTLAISVENATLGDVVLPTVDGLEIMPPAASTTTFSFSAGTYVITTTKKYQLVASRAGDFVIPAFDLPLQNGTTARSQALKIHVLAADAAPGSNVAAPPAGPVILPLANPAAGADPAVATIGALPVPRDRDGGPARVFIFIYPAMTDAYVGQAVPVRIDFYIRQSVNTDQDSLPTIKGGDFLTTDFSVRGNASITVIEGEEYECDTWRTAITAPKSGDFPLASERDTYWVKSIPSSGFSPFGFSRHDNLAHEVITSNQLTMRIHPLPTEGQPARFTGAIGRFQVIGDAQPETVALGEPVTLTFSVAGVGNFDYVPCPTLEETKKWKVYTPVSTTSFEAGDETRTHGVKTFEQPVIPQENGNVPLPSAAFNYFDPFARQYVNVPIYLRTIAVTGATPLPAEAASPAGGAVTPPPASLADDFLPNRRDLGALRASLSPVYRQPWFWMVQGALAALPLAGLLVFFVRRRSSALRSEFEAALRHRSLREVEAAMAEARRKNDTLAFFMAARRAVQLQLGTQWAMPPEAITLGEISRRDPSVAEALAPFYRQADEVIYSGHAGTNIDLARWESVVREFLRLQPA
jgi:hypothetical protein